MIQSYIRPWGRRLHQLRTDPRVLSWLRVLGYFGAGATLSAASLGNVSQPVALGFLLSCRGLPALLSYIGAVAGGFLFWGRRGLQNAAQLTVGLVMALLPEKWKGGRLLQAMMAGVTVAVLGLFFQIQFGDAVAVPLYLLRLAAAMGSTWIFLGVQQQEPRSRFLSKGLWVLALAQILPLPWLGLGYLAAGYMAVGGSFPTAILGGLVLDLTGITPIPMTAVACLGYCLARLPRRSRWLGALCPALGAGIVMALWKTFDLAPLPGLALGGILGCVQPGRTRQLQRRTEAGMAQVQLELAAGVFRQVQQLLLLGPDREIDEDAVLRRAVEGCCGSCPARQGCPERERAVALPGTILHQPLLDGRDLPLFCRREARLLQALHRAQEQLRSLRASRKLQEEYRGALVQQYQFLGEYVQELSDLLGRRGVTPEPRYKPEVLVAANRLDGDNGDRCLRFAGTGCRYYTLLCDGMGTGLGAAHEGRSAAGMLKQLLLAGFPAEYALRSLNSLCALRGMAGIVTADLAECNLDTGRVTVYKWGAAPSWLIRRSGTEKIGTAGPPPGLSVGEGRETAVRLSLRRGETLLLCSDGIDGEALCRRCQEGDAMPFSRLAQELLDAAGSSKGDDATIAAVRLRPLELEEV